VKLNKSGENFNYLQIYITICLSVNPKINSNSTTVRK
jgi:hypothetical protein